MRTEEGWDGPRLVATQGSLGRLGLDIRDRLRLSPQHGWALVCSRPLSPPLIVGIVLIGISAYAEKRYRALKRQGG